MEFEFPLKLKSTVSVVAISYNEEIDLPGFLANVLPWAADVIIVDDESTDLTEQIALDAGAKVRFIKHKRTKEGGFGEQRNVGIRAAKSEWVLNMDIDERVTPVLHQEILTSIADTNLNAYKYRRRNYFLHRPMKRGGWNSWNQPQLARKGYHKYVNVVHEKCVVEGGEQAIGQLKNFMIHLNDDGYSERMRKSMQYCQMDANEYLDLKKRVTGFHLLVRPIITFIKIYFLKKGLFDGVAGLISAMHSAGATFRTLTLVWDRQNHIERNEIESSIQSQWQKHSIE